METERHTLTLTLAVTYEGPPSDRNALENNLLSIATRASEEGWITEGCDDTVVVVANPQVSAPAARNEKLEVLADIVGKLVQAKGRFHTEQTYNELAAAWKDLA